MFKYNGQVYDKVWFTSDEHYGSGRHIALSCRLGFEDYEKEKRINEYARELEKTNLPKGLQKSMIFMIRHSIYGSTINTIYPVDKMNQMLIQKHNERVGDNDIVFHVGDFGDFEYAKYLNGHHVLILGNYEEQMLIDKNIKLYDTSKVKDDDLLNIDNTFEGFCKNIISSYNFIDIKTGYMLELDDNNKNNIKVSKELSNEVCQIFITHKPSNCYFMCDKNNQCQPSEFDNIDKRVTMNIFGHIHETCKVKRFGLNVGVDAHHFYPVSLEEVNFYLYAILHYYDNEVFC